MQQPFPAEEAPSSKLIEYAFNESGHSARGRANDRGSAVHNFSRAGYNQRR